MPTTSILGIPILGAMAMTAVITIVPAKPAANAPEIFILCLLNFDGAAETGPKVAVKLLPFMIVNLVKYVGRRTMCGIIPAFYERG